MPYWLAATLTILARRVQSRAPRSPVLDGILVCMDGVGAKRDGRRDRRLPPAELQQQQHRRFLVEQCGLVTELIEVVRMAFNSTAFP